MAQSVISALLRANRAMQREAARQQRVAAREHASAVREAERARKADDRARAQAERADAANRKRLQQEAEAAHVAAREAEAEKLNSELAAIYDDLDSLLAATLEVDDYVDLEALRRTATAPPFDRTDLEVPIPAPAVLPRPDEPALVLPEAPGLFFRKRKQAAAVAKAEEAHSEAHATWARETEEIGGRNRRAAEEHEADERKRTGELERERARFDAEIRDHNAALDVLIANLGYGTVEAVQEYVSIVASNSVYPDHFQVDSTFTFQPETAELRMRVLVPPPDGVPSVKAYKYKKATDEIVATELSQKGRRDRYASAVDQVALRSLHEVFEADRRRLIKTISLEVGTEEIVPATGIASYIPFVAVAAEREAFNRFELANVVPAETLKHLGAAVSKNPYGLLEADTTGVRRS